VAVDDSSRQTQGPSWVLAPRVGGLHSSDEPSEL